MAFPKNPIQSNNQYPSLSAINANSTSSVLAITGRSLTNAQSIDVSIVDSSGNQISSFGGGTQYTDGAAIPANPIGNALVTDNSGNWAYVHKANPLPVGIFDSGGHQVTVTGGKLDVNATLSGTSGGTSTIDKAAFTVGSDSGTPTMGIYQAALDTITDGHAAVAGLTNKRALFVNLQTSGGAETGVAATPLQVSVANTGANATAIKVDGSAVTQPVSGTVTVQQSTASNLKVDLSGTGANATAIKVDGSGVTQPVSGTVTANAGSGTFNIQANASVNLAQLNAHTILETAHGTNTAGNGGLSVGMMAEFDDVSPTSITENQFGNVRMSANRNVYMNIRDAAGNERGANVNSSNQLSVSVDNTPAVTVSGVATASNQTGGGQKTQIVDGSGNVITTNSTTTTSKFGLDMNILSILGTAPSAAGKIDVKGADGDVFVRQATATNLKTQAENYQGGAAVAAGNPLQVTLANTGANTNKLLVTADPVTFASAQHVIVDSGTVSTITNQVDTNLKQVGGANTATAASGVQKVGIVGNANATLDAVVGAGTAPTNMVAVGGLYNTSAPAPTNGQSAALQLDQAGNLREFPGISLLALSAWTSATSLNATQNIFTNSGAPAVLVQLTQTTTISAGAITFEVSYDGSTWITATASQVVDPTSGTYTTISLPYTLQANTNKYFLISNNGWQGLRIKLSTQITGSGSVTPNYALLAYDPVAAVLAYNPTAANFKTSSNTNDGAGNAITSNSSTFSGKAGLDVNVLGTLGTAFSTAGKVDTKAADGDVFVRSNSASTFPVNANQSGTWTVQPGNTQNTTPWLIKPNISTISTTITRPADTNAYAAGDAFANSTSAPTTGGFTFTSAALVSGGTGVITDAIISSSAKTNYNGELWIFDQATTAINDNAVFDVSTSNVQNLVAIIPFQTSDTNNTTAISYVTGLNIPFTAVGTANLRFLVKLMAAVTPASAEVLAIRIKVNN